MYTIDKDIFNRSLLVTQEYCERQLANNPYANVAEILRSFNPLFLDKPLFSYHLTKYCDITYFEARRNFDPWEGPIDLRYLELFKRQMIHKYQTISLNKAEVNYQGKILVAEIDQTVTDGASEALSHGLIDIYDCPPVDTWFYMEHDSQDGQILYAWIPERFVALINDAIAVNCVDILYWQGEKIIDDTSLSRSMLMQRPTAVGSIQKMSFWSIIKKWLNLS